MSLTQCPFCDHGNPASAKFCNACGGSLTLSPCPTCGAVNEVTARTCYQCHARLGPGDEDAVQALAPVTVSPNPFAARPSQRLVAAAVGVIVLAIGSYFALRPASKVDAPATASTDAKVQEARSEHKPAVEKPASVAGADAKPLDPRPAMAVEPPPAAVKSIGRQLTVPPPPASPNVDARIARPTAPAKKDNGPARRPQPCTDAMAALGLCAQTAAQKKVAPPPAVAAVPRPEPASTGATGAQPCTEAVAALGLCTPKPTPRKE